MRPSRSSAPPRSRPTRCATAVTPTPSASSRPSGPRSPGCAPTRLDHRPALLAARRGRRVRQRRRELTTWAIPDPDPTSRPLNRRASRSTGSGDPDVGDPVVRTTTPRARGPWNHSPFVTGFLLASGALVAWWFGGLIIQASSILILVIVALFIAFGLNPVVQWLIAAQHPPLVAVLLVALGFVAALALFVARDRPVVADQLSTLTKNAPATSTSSSTTARSRSSTRSTTSSTRPRTTSPAVTSPSRSSAACSASVWRSWACWPTRSSCWC